MNILDAVLNAQGGAAAREAGRSLGLSQEQTGSALGALVPALAAGLQRNATQPGGLDSLIGALSNGQHARYLDDPRSLAQPDAVNDGNAILGHILGSKDVSRSVATRAAGQTGLDPSVLKRLLPLAASLVMGAMAKKQGTSGAANAAAGGGLLGMLTPVLDQNRDGSVVDDVIGQAGRFFGGR